MKTWDVGACSVAAIVRVAGELGLLQRMWGTLKEWPGCVHWHFGVPDVRGTVEVTVWEGRGWVSVQAGRRSPEVERVAEAFADRLRGGAAESAM